MSPLECLLELIAGVNGQADRVPTVEEITKAFTDGEGRISRSTFQTLEALATNIRLATLDMDIKR